MRAGDGAGANDVTSRNVYAPAPDAQVTTRSTGTSAGIVNTTTSGFAAVADAAIGVPVPTSTAARSKSPSATPPVDAVSVASTSIATGESTRYASAASTAPWRLPSALPSPATTSSASGSNGGSRWAAHGVPFGSCSATVPQSTPAKTIVPSTVPPGGGGVVPPLPPPPPPPQPTTAAAVATSAALTSRSERRRLRFIRRHRPQRCARTTRTTRPGSCPPDSFVRDPRRDPRVRASDPLLEGDDGSVPEQPLRLA